MQFRGRPQAFDILVNFPSSKLSRKAALFPMTTGVLGEKRFCGSVARGIERVEVNFSD